VLLTFAAQALMGLFSRPAGAKPAGAKPAGAAKALPVVPPMHAAAAPRAVELSPWSDEEAALILQLRALVAGEPPCKNMPLDDGCLVRFLRARNLNLGKAEAMLRAHLEWRKRFGADTIMERSEQIQQELSTGKTFVAPFVDREGRSILVMRPNKENSTSHEGKMLALVYSLERAAAEMRIDGPQKLFLVIDFKGYSMLNAPPMKTNMETLAILQNHYPERLGKAVLLDAPWLISGVFHALQPFIDPTTREKVVFYSTTNPTHLEAIEKLYDRSKAEKALGGMLDEPTFDAERYFAHDPLRAKNKVARVA